jgi:hypothetical protein
METISHQPSRAVSEHWSSRVFVPEMWASLAIVAIWLSVLFAAIYGPDIVTSSAAGDHVDVPSAVVLAPFAFLATWVVARYGFRHEPNVAAVQDSADAA